MLTNNEMQKTSNELKKNFEILDYPVEKILADTKLSATEFDRVLNMNNPNPSHVWMIRDYLEDMLEKEKKEMFPFSKIANHKANRWFRYETPWREK